MPTFKIIKTLFIFLLYLINISETVCYYITDKSFNIQFVTSIDFKNGISEQPWIAAYGFSAIAVGILIAYFTICHFDFGFRFDFLASIIASFCLFKYSLVVKKDLFPFSNGAIFNFNREFIDRFNDYYEATNITVSQPPNEKQRNMIIVLLESFELQNLGTYNHQRKDLLPFMTELAKNTTVLTNVHVAPFTGWSVGSLFAVTCNIPLIKDTNDQGRFHKKRNFKCFPEYLKQLNYDNYVVMPGYPNTGNFVDFFGWHSYKILSGRQHGKGVDVAVVNWTVENFLPTLVNRTNPFNLVLYLSDAHAGRYQNRCHRKNDGLTSYMNEAECVDGYVKTFYEGLQKYHLLDNSEMIIYGDHFVMSKNHNFVDPRRLLVMIPSRKLGEVPEQTSFFDMTHLILKLLNVTYSPDFPFGSSPLEPGHVYAPPEMRHLTYLHNRFSDEMNFNKTSNGYKRLTGVKIKDDDDPRK